ncbi:MAG: 4Fe-4S dicluster domain-containing protein [Cytophagales bacterium]|nr:MAG: 4Fe-4S dicluster domain-containing protein [Cytophagales bacterium]
MENKRYWKGIEEYTNDIEFVKNAEREFPEYLPLSEQSDKGDNPSNGRRDFLKLLGFSVAAASLAACEAPVKKAIPYLNKPEEIDPSIPNYYASTYFEGQEYASILVKTREGRPIKIEGNKLSSITKGGTSVRAQASVLNLYDGTRYKTFVEKNKALVMPTNAQEEEDYKKKVEAIDAKIKDKLANAKNIRIITHSIISPSTNELLGKFVEKYENTKVIRYDAYSVSGMLKANEQTFGKYMMPTYDFSKAEVIVSFSADFLGTWVAPTEFARQYAQTRKVSNENKKMSRHYQFETRLSLTGANADYRHPLKPSAEALAIKALYEKLTGSGKVADEKLNELLDKAVADLKKAKGKSLVISASNDVNVQLVINAINNVLENYGKTIDTNVASKLQQGKDGDMKNFIADVANGSIDVVIFYRVNPIYNHPDGKKLSEALSKVGTKIALATRPNETAELCDYVCADHHYLEAWNDAEPKTGFYSLAQPTITPLFKTRQAQESLMKWAGIEGDFYSFIRKYWNTNLFKKQNKAKDFESFWTRCLHDGIFESGMASVAATEETKKDTVVVAKKETKEDKTQTAEVADINTALNAIASTYKASNEIEVVFYEKIAIGAGYDAGNPWLQEMPDPISKATWDNYVAISQKTANDLKIAQGDIIKVDVKGKGTVELPTLIQPGQAAQTISIALGYGRNTKNEALPVVGKNVYNLLSYQNDTLSYVGGGVTITATGNKEELAQTQTQHTIMGRKIVQETSLKEYQTNFDEVLEKYAVEIHTSAGVKKPTEISLWHGHKYPNHSWGMVIDLNSCIGCGACTIACQAENNIPVVGKKEVRTGREMHWIRIDRYYSTDANLEDKSPSGYKAMEIAGENPEVVFQPMMCQHCNNAPCETVCPVLATTHSTEGLNQMAYNRCIGTRYCANNCPYKVRRFNWFHYAEDDRFTAVNFAQTSDLGRMVLNPDVTVRSRGVMEKCTLCVQRIQVGKLNAKKEKRKINDGEIVTACAEVCPTEAITFGDMNDTGSKIAKTLGIKEEKVKGEHGAKDETRYSITEKRAFHVLEEINVRPQIAYLTKIRNKDVKEEEKKA